MPSDDARRFDAATPEGVTREAFLRAGGAGAVGVAALGLAGCFSSSSGTTSTSSKASPTPAGPPKRGGTLRAGLAGGSSTETADPQNNVIATDDMRAFAMFNGLVEFDLDAQPKLMLAEEITPNSTATEWTIRVKDGIEWHDGRTLSADDVMYSINRMMNPKKPLPGAALIRAFDPKTMKKLDKRTLRVKCTFPFATLVSTLTQHQLTMVPVDFDLKKPVGTGPFKFKSFTPGTESRHVRNENYFEEGLPYLDELVLIDFSDETSQVNALLGGQVDVVNYLSHTSVQTIQSGGGKAVVNPSGSYQPFTMRVDKAPFDDVRVRQAMRLAIDRPRMRELVFGGNGFLGNDVFGILDELYDKSLPQRQQDIEQAKSLLKAAGQSDLRVTLTTGDIAQGTVKAAQVLADQVKAAGIDVKLDKQPSGNFYGPNFLQWTFAQDFWQFKPYLDQVASSFLPESPFNEVHWKDDAYAKLAKEAQAAVDKSRRAELAHELQKIDYEQGGYIIPYFAPVIDAHSKKVEGLGRCRTGFGLCNGTFKAFWFNG